MIESKSAGAKCLQAGGYKEALTHFTQAASLLEENEIDNDPKRAVSLQVSLLYTGALTLVETSTLTQNKRLFKSK